MFEITKDEEFYVYLKSRLALPLLIVAEPSTDYYSEYLFDYTLYEDGRMQNRWNGDFRKIPKGTLVEEAKKLC